MKKAIFIFFIFIVFCVTSGTGQENKKARELAEPVFKKYVIKCGDSWYFRHEETGLFEMKNEGSISLYEKPLTESDKLNGWKFIGRVTYSSIGPQRRYVDKSKKWTEWFEDECAIDIIVTNKNNIWTVDKSTDFVIGGAFINLTCEDVPRMLSESEIRTLIEETKKGLITARNGIKYTDKKHWGIVLNIIRNNIYSAEESARLIVDKNIDAIVMAEGAIDRAVTELDKNEKDFFLALERAEKLFSEYLQKK
jgi:hypothetical protein